MRIDVLTLFPEMFEGVLGSSILKKAAEKGAAEYHTHNFREFSDNKHQSVDDYPYGGGAGMVLKPQPIFDALEQIAAPTSEGKKPRVILLCPQGKRFTQKKAEELAGEEQLVFVCGHYEGIDERVIEEIVDEEISVGDYVLTHTGEFHKGLNSGCTGTKETVKLKAMGICDIIATPNHPFYGYGFLLFPGYR